MAPVKWWNFRPTSSATSRKSGSGKGLANVALESSLAPPAKHERSSRRTSRRPKPYGGLARGIVLRELRFCDLTAASPMFPGGCADHVRCSREGRIGHARQRHHVPGGDSARRFAGRDRKSIRLNSSHSQISYAVFCLKKKKKKKKKKTINKKKQNTTYKKHRK